MPPLEQLPRPEDLLDLPPPSSPPDRPDLPPAVGQQVIIHEFDVVGSTVFTPADFNAVLEVFTNRPLTFTQLLEARDAVTDLYVERGYITSGAFLPADQVIDDGTLTIQVLEGELSDITINGTARLNSQYIQARVERAAATPLNLQTLLATLQRLQQDPAIATLSAELFATPQPGTNALALQVQEAETFDLNLQLNNFESPLVGTFQKQLVAREENLTGFSDALTLIYQTTGASQNFELAYERPLNALNSTLALGYASTNGEVIEPPFSLIAPQSETSTWEIGIRQPLLDTPQDQLTLGLQLEQKTSRSFIQFPGADRVGFGFPGSGATADGFTRLTVLEFTQQWQRQTPRQLISVNSQVRWGTPVLNAIGSSDPNEPGVEFWAWQGQALWLQQLSPDWLLVARAAGQLSDRPLVSSELFGLGGANLRGYRKDQILADGGFLASLELQAPLLRWPEQEAVMLIAPFVDYGLAWNRDDQPLQEQTLAAVGTGLIFRIADGFSMRLDYALPLNNVRKIGNSWQESGFLFAFNISPF